MNQIEQQRIALHDLCTEIGRLRHERQVLDGLCSQSYKKARSAGIITKVAKLIIAELGGAPANQDQIWSRYVALTGIDENAITTLSDALPALDKILGPAVA
jgi:hypothetical protein